jgi:SNF2 family DNA or RNA helicase
LHLTDIYGTE